jgi:hypothetical protein
MTYRIHFTLPDGSTDSVVLYADSIDELRAQAREAVDSRGGTDEWSEPA